MFATKDHGEKFYGKIELTVESGKAKMSGMSRLSFPKVSVSKREGRKKTKKAEERRNEEDKEGGKVEFERGRKRV